MAAVSTISKHGLTPRDYFESLRASLHPRTEYENAILRVEIAQRYALRERRRLADPLRFMTLIRLDELERLLLDRYGLHLPDDDAGWDDFTIVAHHLAHLGAVNKTIARIVEWAEIWAPDFSLDKVIERAKVVVAKPKKWKADTLARRLGLTMVKRTALGITTIGAIGTTKAQRAALRKQKKAEVERLRRAAKSSGKPRGRPSKGKPWLELGISKTTYYDRRTKMRGQHILNNGVHGILSGLSPQPANHNRPGSRMGCDEAWQGEGVRVIATTSTAFAEARRADHMDNVIPLRPRPRHPGKPVLAIAFTIDQMEMLTTGAQA